ncbi:MAG: hypothetical protein JNL74_20640, partial [Fibrobacteres bacterium]|nr:hypothetical protein [Fibrobacterota bacterium]
MVKAIFFFFLVVCIIAAAISDWRIRRLDGRPIKEKSGIETIAIDKSDPLTGSASVDITAKLEIIASSPSSADEPYFLGAPWNLNKRPIKEKNAAPIVRKLGSKFYCKALIFKNKNAFTAIVNVDLPAINAAGRKAALASLQAAGYSTAAVMIITPGFINLPISISPTDFAAAVVAAVKQADAASGRSDYAFVNSPDTILRTEKSRISIPDCGAVDLPSALFSQVPDSGKNDDATSIINRWYSIVLKDTSLYP